ncbi:MAG: RIP metalloprotease RseP [Candidatus Tritonobacter lacicola]|nr:RIP metalloprotease RseP [Candidatus Tritonobacter lacicola]
MGFLNPATLINILRFAIVLGVLIFVHELGHFILARRFGVLVLRFSFGFGPRLFGVVRKGTDYCLSAIPLGGYVKMAGQEDFPTPDKHEGGEEEVPDHLKYSSKTVGRRVVIVVAGAAMNILLGAVLFSAIFMVGRELPLYVKEGVVGAVIPGSPAAEAGVKSGDRVVSVNGRPVSDWTEIMKITGTHAGRPLRFGFERDGELIYRELTPVEMEGVPNAVVGLSGGGVTKVVSVIEEMPASRADLREGDVVKEINGRAVYWPSIIAIIGESDGKSLTLSVVGEDGTPRLLEMTPDETGIIKGVLVEDGIVTQTGREEKTGMIRPGDRIIAINGRELSGKAVDEEIARSPGSNLMLTVLRKGRFIPYESRFDVALTAGSRGLIGSVFTVDTEMRLEKYPWYRAIPLGIAETVSSVKMLYQILASIITGRLSPRTIGGPIAIYVYSAKTAEAGFVTFLYFVAMISVNLGVINLLPFPVLDGGHVVFLVIEKIRRRPLGEKQMDIMQQIGLALILLLVVLVFYNDIVNWVLP